MPSRVEPRRPECLGAWVVRAPSHMLRAETPLQEHPGPCGLTVGDRTGSARDMDANGDSVYCPRSRQPGGCSWLRRAGGATGPRRSLVGPGGRR